MSHSRWSLIAAIVTMVVWGANFAFVKYVLDALGVGAFLFIRFLTMPLLAFLLLALVFRRNLAATLPKREDVPRFIACGLLGHSLHTGMVFWGINLSTAFSSALVLTTVGGWMVGAWVNHVRGIARSAPLMYLPPPIAGIVAWLTLGEHFTWLKIAGAGITMAGIAWAQFGGGRPPPREAAQP